MAKKKVGELIKEARLKAELTQEQLASKVEGLSASELSKVERGEKDLTDAELKQIAKVTGVTQKSLLEAPSNLGKTTTTTAKKTTEKKTTTTTKKTTAATTSVKLTAKEKKLLEQYRKADDKTQDAVEALLSGKKNDGDNVIGTLLENALGMLSGLGK